MDINQEEEELVSRGHQPSFGSAPRVLLPFINDPTSPIAKHGCNHQTANATPPPPTHTTTKKEPTTKIAPGTSLRSQSCAPS